MCGIWGRHSSNRVCSRGCRQVQWDPRCWQEWGGGGHTPQAAICGAAPHSPAGCFLLLLSCLARGLAGRRGLLLRLLALPCLLCPVVVGLVMLVRLAACWRGGRLATLVCVTAGLCLGCLLLLLPFLLGWRWRRGGGGRVVSFVSKSMEDVVENQCDASNKNGACQE